jgi:ATP-dependent exoDNAse (exonuclease V) beta subunit
MGDLAQRKEALNIEQSFIVQAPAGSGKTELLTQRYLKLLGLCNHPEEVIALTFTKKAVDELSKRIFDALKTTTEPTAEHKKITFNLAKKVRERSDKLDWQLLKNPIRLKIFTLDSLAGQIVKQQINPINLMLEPVAEWQIVEIYQQAINEVLLLIDEPDYQESITEVLKHLGNDTDKFIALLMSMLQKRDQWLRQLLNDQVLNKTVLNKTLEEIVNTHLATLKNITDTFDNNFYLDIGLELTEKNLDFYLALKEKCLTKKGEWRKNLLKKYPELEQKNEVRDGLNALENLPNTNYSDYEWKILKNITKVLKLTLAQLNIVFNERQQCDYIAISLEADNALGDMENPSDIALFLDNKINHILLDEFQDTSITQIQLLTKLLKGWQVNDGKTLFLVGDPMQSIYRFREAEVGLFLKIAQEGIANIKLKHLKLTTNFRSTKAIVTKNNLLFQNIFPEDADSNLGKVSYTPSTASNDIECEKAIEFYAFVKGEEIQQAQQVLKTIKAIPEDEEIAILVRSRSHLDEIIECLNAEKQEFEATKIQKLNDYWLVRDLLVLTSAINNPNDKLSWLSLLRSPWCGLGLEDLLLISDNKKASFYYYLLDKQSLLSESGQKRLDFFLKAIEPIFNKKGSFLLSDLILSASQRLMVNDYLTPLEEEIKYLFFKVLIKLEKNIDFSIVQLQQSLANLYTPTKKSRIKLMTIHNAKGLEFDNIILAHLNKTPPPDKGDILLTLENISQNFMVAPSRGSYNKEENQTYKYIKHINKQKADFELMRLLYVAMTRAKKKIVLLSTAEFNKKEQRFKAREKTFLAFLMPFFLEKFAEISVDTDEIIKVIETPKQLKIPQDDLIIAPNISNELMLFEANEENRQRNIGVLVHHYFEFNKNPESKQIYFDLLNMKHANVNHIQSDVDCIKQMLENTKNDKSGQWIFQTRETTQVEASFSFVESKQQKTIVIDRLFIEEDILWIIDFKTTAQGDIPLDVFKKKMLDTHQTQLNKYQQILKKVYQNPIKKALYLPAIPLLLEL